MSAPGCPQCGLVGCTCEVTEAFNGICKKCKSDPCECAGKPLSRVTGERLVCTVCRRQQQSCICESHVSVRHSYGDPHAASEGTKRPYSDGYISTLCNEALNFYYQRDAEGLQRWLRRVLR